MQNLREFSAVLATSKAGADISALSGRIPIFKTITMGKRILTGSSFVFLRAAVSLLTLIMIIMSITAADVFSSTTVAWTAPTTNTDGTPLTDLAGYKIYYGTTSGNYPNSINAGKVTSYAFNNLTSGTPYYFVATAYDTTGFESAFSNEVAKTEPVVSGPAVPTVTAFTIPSTSTSLTISITSFTATDNAGVTGYIITGSPTAPVATAAGWSAAAQKSYTSKTAGSKTLYAWAKDAAGKVSSGVSARVIITLPLSDTPSPTINTINNMKASIGVFRDGAWYIDTNQNGMWDPGVDAAMSFGVAGDIPVMGDWDGSGTKKIGVFRNGAWYLDMNGSGVWDASVDTAISFGMTGDVPVVGDWNGDGKSKIGVFRNGYWYLDTNGNNTWDASVDTAISFGMSVDIPVVGDWNGDGRSKIGVFRNGNWYLDRNGNNAWEPGVDAAIPFGVAGDIPVVGDWNGTGRSKIGVFRNGNWYLDSNGNNAWDPGVDTIMAYGIAGDIPVVGDWNGTGKIKIGVVRNGNWYLDMLGNGTWTPGDSVLSFGTAGDKPIVK